MTTALNPNGLAVSPDGKTLYVGDNGPKRRALLAVDLDESGGASNPRVLVDLAEGRGIDGMTVAADGSIVAAAGSGETGGVHVFRPGGQRIGFLAVPEPPTNVEFGGPTRQTLYITAGKGLYRVETNMKGSQVWPPKSGQSGTERSRLRGRLDSRRRPVQFLIPTVDLRAETDRKAGALPKASSMYSRPFFSWPSRR